MDKPQYPVMKSTELSWYKRAQLKSAQPHEDTIFQQDRWDFLPELMPFNEHPLWDVASDSSKRMAASYGWLMYNLRTVCIETKVVSPLCYSIIEDKNPLTKHFYFKRIASQTLVDESYHTLLSIEGIKGVVENRSLPEIDLPELNFLKEYKNYLSLCSHDWEKDIVQMSLVVASEVLISDYLSLIATSDTIQPLCRSVTRTHWRDELAHANIFKLIAEKIISTVTREQSEFMIECIIKSSGWFDNQELESWERILTYVDIPRANEIIDDCRMSNKKERGSLAEKKINALIDLLRSAKFKNDSFSEPMLKCI